MERPLRSIFCEVEFTAGAKATMEVVVRHLTEIVTAIKEYFERAAVAGEQVFEMLENIG